MKRLFDLEGFGISRNDNMNSFYNVVLKEFVNSAKLIECLYTVKPTGNETSLCRYRITILMRTTASEHSLKNLRKIESFIVRTWTLLVAKNSWDN